MFRAHVLIIRRSKLYCTACGIITLCGWPSRARDDTRGCIMQFWHPDDEHMCSKHVEAWNKTYCETNFVHQVGYMLRYTVDKTSKYVTLIAVLRQQWLRERFSLLRSSYIDCLVPAELLSALFFPHACYKLMVAGLWSGNSSPCYWNRGLYIVFHYTPPFAAVKFSTRRHVRF